MALYNRVNSRVLKNLLRETSQNRTTLSFYKYHQINNPKDFRDELYLAWDALGVWGRIYIAQEGINGQLSVPTENLEKLKNHIYF